MNALLATTPVAMHEALAAFELLRRLEFPSEEIFFGTTVGRMVYIELQHGAEKFSIPCGMLPLGWTREHAFERWKAIAQAMADIDVEEFVSLWKRSAMRLNAERIALHLLGRGVVPPAFSGANPIATEGIRKFLEWSKR